MKLWAMLRAMTAFSVPFIDWERGFCWIHFTDLGDT